MNNEDRSLESRIRRLEDVNEIHALCIAYGYHIDRQEFDSYAHLFSEDGVWAGPPGEFKGPDAILAMLQQVMGPATGPSCHVITNPIIEIDGDRASAHVITMYVKEGADGSPNTAQVGHLDHTFIRERDGWKFLRRGGGRDIPRP